MAYRAANTLDSMLGYKNDRYINFGWAGALGVTLGGLNYYGGRKSFRALMGPGKRELTVSDIRSAVKLMILTTVLFLIFCLTIFPFIGWW